MVKQGTLLEKNVERIFSLAGFETSRNVKRETYEIDVLATHRNLKIAIECKERDNGPLTVRNLIHEWAGKKRYINVDKILIVIYGASVSSKDMELAEKEDIEIWDSDKFEKYLDLSHELKEKSLPLILKDLGITTKEVEELNRKIESDIKKKKEELDEHVDILYNKIPTKRREKIEHALERLVEEGNNYIGTSFIEFSVNSKNVFLHPYKIKVSFKGDDKLLIKTFPFVSESFENMLSENKIWYIPKLLELDEIEINKKYGKFGSILVSNSNIFCLNIITVIIELFFKYWCGIKSLERNRGVIDKDYDVNIEYHLLKEDKTKW